MTTGTTATLARGLHGERIYVLPADHPAVVNNAWMKRAGRKWRVVWRDFLSMKQDADFDRKWQAERFLAKRETLLRIVDVDYLAEAGMSFEEAEAFWLSPAAAKIGGPHPLGFEAVTDEDCPF